MKRISTDLFATDADLTADLRLKEDSVIKQEADRLILHYRTMFSTFHLESENYDVNEIVNRLLCKEEAEKPIDFIAFSRTWIKETTIKGKDNYTTALNSFVRFIGEEEFRVKVVVISNHQMMFISTWLINCTNISGEINNGLICFIHF